MERMHLNLTRHTKKTGTKIPESKQLHHHVVDAKQIYGTDKSTLLHLHGNEETLAADDAAVQAAHGLQNSERRCGGDKSADSIIATT